MSAPEEYVAEMFRLDSDVQVCERRYDDAFARFLRAPTRESELQRLLELAGAELQGAVARRHKFRSEALGIRHLRLVRGR